MDIKRLHKNNVISKVSLYRQVISMYKNNLKTTTIQKLLGYLQILTEMSKSTISVVFKLMFNWLNKISKE